MTSSVTWDGWKGEDRAGHGKIQNLYISGDRNGTLARLRPVAVFFFSSFISHAAWRDLVLWPGFLGVITMMGDSLNRGYSARSNT